MPEKIRVIIDEDLEDILPTFLENRSNDIEKIKSALESSDLKAIEVIAHKLAGNAGSYGLHDLGKIGVALEESCNNESLGNIKEYFEQYKDYMARLEIVFE